MKVYYDKETGYLCERYPKDIEVKEDTPFIELPDEEVEETYIVEYGKFWAIKDNKLVKVDDIELQATEEYKQEIKNNEIADLKNYLNNTDYVIAKLNEAKIEDEELFEELKVKYAEILTKRKQARARINELEN
ncbi:MAG: hypothetical protein SPC26_00745 [Lactobacillus amylovorus]|nr:hypothetical protein [Lactobacillus amylovorus]